MATSTKRDTKPPTIVVRKMPVVLNKYKVVNNKYVCDTELQIQNILYKDDVIYEGDGDFLKEKYSKILLYNRSHRLQNTSKTVLKCIGSETVVKTSDNITNLIGQSNYDTVFSALCSVLSQDLRIKGIIALLTAVKETVNTSTQTETCNMEKELSEASTQTQALATDKKKLKCKRRMLMPYIVKDTVTEVKKIKKLVIHPTGFAEQTTTVRSESIHDHIESYKDNSTMDMSIVKEEFVDQIDRSNDQDADGLEIDEKEQITRDENMIHEENSNESLGNISVFSVRTNNSIFNDLSLLNNVDRHMQPIYEGFKLNIGDCDIILRTKPEDEFHIATKENMMYLNTIEKQKLLLFQASIDFKQCLTMDDDGNLPLHTAVLNNDTELLKRHCAMLKIKREDVDMTGSDGYTALKMALIKDFPLCTGILLRMGADPLQVDDDHRTPLHYAAEGSKDSAEALIKYCTEHARKILQENDDLWKPTYSKESDDQLAKYLLKHVCTLCDDQGYTALMVASQIGNCENVKLLVEAVPGTVNQKMPTSGNTALYLAIVAACADAYDKGNKTKLSDKYQQTIECLLENGADPSIENYSGSNVDALLVELNISELSMLIARKVTAMRYFDGKPSDIKIDSIMLVKNETGGANIMELDSEKIKKGIANRSGKRVITIDKKLKTNPLAKVTSKANANKVKTAIVEKKNATINNGSVIPNSNQNSSIRNSEIKILDSKTIKVENNICTLPTDSKYLVDNTGCVQFPNIIRLDNIKTSPIKIAKTKEIKIGNNTSICYTIDNVDVPISNAAAIIQKSNANVQISRSLNQQIIQISNLEMPCSVQAGSSDTKPVIIESKILKSADDKSNDARKPEFADKFNSFIRNGEIPNDGNKRKMRVVVTKGAKTKKIEK